MSNTAALLDPIYLAGLAGQAARKGNPIPVHLLRWQTQEGKDLVRAELHDLRLHDRLLAYEETDSLALRLLALLSIDHTLCAAQWAGCTAAVADELRTCCRLIKALPWPDLSRIAQEIYSHLPVDDIARPLWATLAEGEGNTLPSSENITPAMRSLLDFLFQDPHIVEEAVHLQPVRMGVA